MDYNVSESSSSNRRASDGRMLRRIGLLDRKNTGACRCSLTRETHASQFNKLALTSGGHAVNINDARICIDYRTHDGSMRLVGSQSGLLQSTRLCTFDVGISMLRKGTRSESRRRLAIAR